MLKAPDKVVSIVPRKPKAARTELKVLDAYVDQIRLWSSAPTKSDAIRFENTEVEVSPWAVRAIHRFCNSPTPIRGEVEDLITQGVAVIAKCQTDLAEGEGSSKNRNEVYARQAEMMLDVAVGTVVVHELQTKGNALLGAGNNDGAKELNQFLHRVRHVVGDVRRSLGESERQRAIEFASALRDKVVGASKGDGVSLSTSPAETGVDIEARAQRTAADPRPSRATKRPRLPSTVFKIEETEPTRTHGYLIPVALVVILAALAIYGITGRAQAPIQGDASDSLTAALSKVPGVTEVQDRMPYVVLTVHNDFWTSNSKSKRQDWIKDLTRPVTRHGYTGLVVRSSSGTPLAEWVQDRGIKYADPE